MEFLLVHYKAEEYNKGIAEFYARIKGTSSMALN